MPIHHQFTRTSGLSGKLSDLLYREIERGTNGPVKPAQQAHYLDLTSLWFLDSPTSEKNAYINFSYILIAHIIEEASGQSYPDYLNQVIFTPLKMLNTGYHIAPSGMATLYVDGDITTEWQVRLPTGSEGAGHLGILIARFPQNRLMVVVLANQYLDQVYFWCLISDEFISEKQVTLME